jgi:hypothetical protein
MNRTYRPGRHVPRHTAKASPLAGKAGRQSALSAMRVATQITPFGLGNDRHSGDQDCRP